MNALKNLLMLKTKLTGTGYRTGESDERGETKQGEWEGKRIREKGGGLDPQPRPRSSRLPNDVLKY